ncbi:MAG: MBL fold metallo-hydrolase [Gemmatimonadetes bacterium]|nr:MBL fold metallo-hydrolase [Gemmatimonadota bacterium]
MRIQFCGGARTVTGSQHLLSINGQQLLLDCGLYQGRRADADRINRSFRFDPGAVDAAILSHAHIDHAGNLPSLVKRGFTGPIYATAATVDLCQVMLRDSAYLQERDVHHANKVHRKRGESEAVSPLYDIDDAEGALKAFVGVQYDRAFDVLPGVRATLRDAGHILGSAGVLLEIDDGGRQRRIGFSGDVGRTEVPILRDPNVLRDLDVLIMESTYGGRFHSPREDVEEELASTVREVTERGGRIIIPAFSVGRTQLVVYYLHKLFDDGRIPDLPIFVDSPLARAATDIFRTHPECFDRETWLDFLSDEKDPFGFERLRYVASVEESKALNKFRHHPHIIISASGMAEAGRILHHLRNNIGDPKSLVLLVGHAAEHTLARRLRDGADKVKIFGEEHRVRCQVKSMDHFSGHADESELLEYVGLNPPQRLERVFLVHGETGPAEALRSSLLDSGCPQVEIPQPGQVFEL